jgi:hypothetical protein
MIDGVAAGERANPPARGAVGRAGLVEARATKNRGEEPLENLNELAGESWSGRQDLKV